MHDCIVIGGGVIGLMTARELACGGLRVAVLERGKVGMACSGAGGGILSPLYPWQEPAGLNPLVRWSQAYYPQLAAELQVATGIDPEWWCCGMHIQEPVDREAVASWAADAGYVPEFADKNMNKPPSRDQREGFNGGLDLPHVAQINNPLLLAALKANLQDLGVAIHEGLAVQRLNVQGHRFQSLETTSGQFKAAMTVLATGAWASELLPDLPIRPVRGQMLCYQGAPGQLEQIRLQQGIYLIPRRDGRILAGSTVEDTGFENGTTTEAKKELSKAAEVLLPGINQLSLSGHWSGLRPAPPANLPYSCAHPEIEGLYLNTGQFRNGILLAPGCARILGDIILQRPLTISAAPFQFTPGWAEVITA